MTRASGRGSKQGRAGNLRQEILGIILTFASKLTESFIVDTVNLLPYRTS